MESNSFVKFFIERILEGKITINDIPDGNVKREVDYQLKEMGYEVLTN